MTIAPALCPKCGAYWHPVGYHYVWTAAAIIEAATRGLIPNMKIDITNSADDDVSTA